MVDTVKSKVAMMFCVMMTLACVLFADQAFASKATDLKNQMGDKWYREANDATNYQPLPTAEDGYWMYVPARMAHLVGDMMDARRIHGSEVYPTYYD